MPTYVHVLERTTKPLVSLERTTKPQVVKMNYISKKNSVFWQQTLWSCIFEGIDKRIDNIG